MTTLESAINALPNPLPDEAVNNGSPCEKTTDDYTKVNFDDLMNRLIREFSEGQMGKNWVLFRVNGILALEIDIISGFLVVKTSAGIFPEYPFGSGNELNSVISRLRSLVRQRNKLVELGFYPSASGIDESSKYSLKMVKAIQTPDVDKIIDEIKSIRSTMEKIS